MGELPGDDSDLGAGWGRQREIERMQERQQAQASDGRRKDERQKLVGGGCGQSQGGRINSPVD